MLVLDRDRPHSAFEPNDAELPPEPWLPASLVSLLSLGALLGLALLKWILG